MFKRTLEKPDGRSLLLYSRRPIAAEIEAPSPPGVPARGMHLRWHPLRGEWVAYAGHRQHRTFLPPPEYNPLAPMSDPLVPTEVPAGDYQVAVFENLFPTLSRHASPDVPHTIVPTAPGLGACEVVVFTQDPKATLGTLPLWHIELIIDVWADRYTELGRRPEIRYVMPFENRGVEVGVTLHHPHGQVYAYPFVPPVAARELEQQRHELQADGTGLLRQLVQAEIADGARLVFGGARVAAFVPVCARYPYEVWIVPVRPASSLADLDREERAELARALKTVLLKYDGLWSRPFPYIMVVHQAPTDGATHPEAHVHFELYPAYRLPGRLKYLAGSEIGAGVFTADTLPEEKAAELRAVQVTLE